MVQITHCPQCGAQLSADGSPEGLCPKCLLAMAMASGQTDITVEGFEETGWSKLGEKVLDEMIGQVLDGKYHLDKKLGQGGMGAVYLGIHLGTSRPVAVKVIAPQFMRNEEFVERFKREARAMGRLRHPNVVNVTDFGFAEVGSDRLAYLVMEYLDGFTLGEMMKRKQRLKLGFVVDVVEQTCLAMDEAHKRGIIHRDLKPDNIWLEPNGRGGYNVKVLDFGLAKLRETAASGATAEISGNAQPVLPLVEMSADALSVATSLKSPKASVDISTQIRPATGSDKKTISEDESTQIVNRGATAGTIDPRTVPDWLTRVGMILGTPLYMSPEQCHGEGLDTRSDIYSLGVIVYEMLTCETPFTGNMYQLIVKHSEMPAPPLKEKRHDIPKVVAAAVMSALAKNPAERPASAAAFATALRANVDGEDPILKQADMLHKKHRSTFICISMLTSVPFILANFWLVLLSKWFLLLLLPITLLANMLNTALSALTVEQLRADTQSSVRLRSILANFVARLGALLSTAARAVLTNSSLYIPVAMVEEIQGREAFTRSKALADPIRSLVRAVQAHNYFAGFVTLLFISLFSLLTSSFYSMASTVVPVVIGSIFLFCLGLSYTPYAVSIALLYLKARRISGERLDETFIKKLEEDATGRPIASYKQTAGILAVKFGKLLLAFFGTLSIMTLFWFLAGSARFDDPLIIAARNGEIDTVKKLIDGGADVNVKGKMGETPLIRASTAGRTDVIKELLAAGADINARDNEGKTALMDLFWWGRTDVVKILLAAGADVNARDNDGKTALMYAASYGRADSVKELLAAGADASLKDEDGKTAFMHAVESRRNDVVELLKAAGTLK
jgi:serine/threonine protein kinase